MFISIVIFCFTPEVSSCKFTANVKNPHINRGSCMVDAKAVASKLLSKGVYAKAGCIKLLNYV